jgi:hypothetical protein
MSDISELFARDPLKLTNDDISTIVGHYRTARGNFLIGDKKAGTTPSRKEKKTPVQLDLKELGINLDDIEI